MNTSLVKTRICRVFVVLLCMVMIAAGTFLNRGEEVQAAGSVKIENFWVSGDRGGFHLQVEGYPERTNLTITLTFSNEVSLSTNQSAIKVSTSVSRKPTVTVTGWNGKAGSPDGNYYIDFSWTNTGSMSAPTAKVTKTTTFSPTPTKKATDSPTPTKKPATNTPTKKPTNTPTKKPTNTATPKPTKKPTDAPEATSTPVPTDTPVPTEIPETSESTAAPEPTKTPIETEVTVPGVVDPTDPSNPGGGGTTESGNNTPAPTNPPKEPVELKTAGFTDYLPWIIIALVLLLIIVRFTYLNKGKGYSAKESLLYIIPGTAKAPAAKKGSSAPQARPQTNVTSSQTGAGLASAMKEINAMKAAEAGVKAAPAQAATVPGRAPVKRPPQYSSNPNVAQQAKIQAAAPKRPAASAGVAPVKAAPASQAPAAAPVTPAFKPVTTAAAGGVVSASAATAQTRPAAPAMTAPFAAAPAQQAPATPAFKPLPPAAAPAASQAPAATPAQQAPGLKPPIKRPAQYSVNHAATTAPASNVPAATHVAPVATAAAASVTAANNQAQQPKAAPAASQAPAATPAQQAPGLKPPIKRPAQYSVNRAAGNAAAGAAAQGKTPADNMIANKNEVHTPEGKADSPRKVAPAPGAAPKESLFAPQLRASSAQKASSNASQPASAPQPANTDDKGHGIKGIVGKLPFGKKAPAPAEPVAYPKTASTSGTTNYAAAMKEIAAERRAEAAAAAPAAQNNAPAANAPAPGLKPPVKRPAQYSVNHAATGVSPAAGQQTARPVQPAPAASPASQVQKADPVTEIKSHMNVPKPHAPVQTKAPAPPPASLTRSSYFSGTDTPGGNKPNSDNGDDKK